MSDRGEALAALSQALRLEQEGRAFYLQAADRVLDERGERTLRALADDEQRHEQMIVRQLHALEGGETYVLLPDLEVPAIDLDRRVFAPERREIDVDSDVMQILHVALDNEIRSYDLYRAAAQRTADEAGAQMYRWLASAELTHANLLMMNYEAISNGGSWV